MSAEAPSPAIRTALEHVAPGQIVGLGTGRAAAAFVRALAARVREGLDVKGVPTSLATESLATEEGIPLTPLEEVTTIDVTFDGADEVDPNLDLIKGYGGALIREKITAAASQKLIILIGPEKQVPILGTRGKLPVEVLPIATHHAATHLRPLGCEPSLRGGKTPFTTDNGSHILDCKIAPIENAQELERAILAIPGVVGTGLFLGMADLVIVGGDPVRVLERSS